MTGKVNISATDFWIISPLYRFTFDRFNDDGFDPKFSSRDATNNAGGVTQYLLFWNRQAHVRAGYEFNDNKAEGLNFDTLGHKGTIGLSLPVIEEIKLDASTEYSNEKSIHFQGPRERRTKQQVYSAGLSRNLWDLFLVTFSYQYTFANSNYAELESIREVFSFTVSVNF